MGFKPTTSHFESEVQLTVPRHPMSRTILYYHVYMISDFPITYRNVSVLCQSECACLHETVNMVVSFVKTNKYADAPCNENT